MSPITDASASAIIHQAESDVVQPPSYYTDYFFARASELVKCALNLDLSTDLDYANCVDVYKYLINNMY